MCTWALCPPTVAGTRVFELKRSGTYPSPFGGECGVIGIPQEHLHIVITLGRHPKNTGKWSEPPQEARTLLGFQSFTFIYTTTKRLKGHIEHSLSFQQRRFFRDRFGIYRRLGPAPHFSCRPQISLKFLTLAVLIGVALSDIEWCACLGLVETLKCRGWCG